MKRRRGHRAAVLRTARCYPDLTVAQIARVVRCAESTVRRHLQSLPGPGPGRRLSPALRAEPYDWWRKNWQGETPVTVGLLRRLAVSRDAWLSSAAGRHRQCPAATLRMLATIAVSASTLHDTETIGYAVAANPNTSPAALARLSHSLRQHVVRAVAEHRRCPVLVLHRLACHRVGEVRSAVAAHPAAHPATLRLLEADNDPQVRQCLALNPQCPPTMMQRFAADSDDLTRLAVARNPNCPQDVLINLTQDPQLFVRRAVAEHHSTPPRSLAVLTTDSTWHVRASAARNPNCPIGAQLAAHHRNDQPLNDDAVDVIAATRAALTALTGCQRL